MSDRLSEIQTLLETGGGHISGTNALINSHAIAMQKEIHGLQAEVNNLKDIIAGTGGTQKVDLGDRYNLPLENSDE